MKQGWEIKKFADVFDLQMGKTPSRDDSSYWNGDNVWVSIADLNDKKYISESKEGITDKAVKESGIKIVPKNTVIMSFKLSIGKTAITTTPLFTNEAIMAFIEKEKDTLIPEYIYYYLKGYKWAGANKAVLGMTLNKKTISEQTFSYPPLPEQEKIVAELDCLSGIIEKKRQQLKELDALAQSIFYEMFGDPVTNEKGWKVKEIQDIFKVTSSKRILQSEWKENGIPFYKVADVVALIKGEKINPSVFIDETNYDELCKANLVPTEGDILITSRGTLGQCYIVNKSDRFYFQDGMITWLSPKKNIATPIFTKGVFSNDSFFESLSSIANNSTIAYISIKQLSKKRFILPPLPLQQTFASKIEAIEKQKALIKQSIVETETLFNARMQEYFG